MYELLESEYEGEDVLRLWSRCPELRGSSGFRWVCSCLRMTLRACSSVTWESSGGGVDWAAGIWRPLWLLLRVPCALAGVAAKGAAIMGVPAAWG